MGKIEENVRKHKKVILLVIFFIIIFIIFISSIFSFVNIGNETILSGISIMGVDVSGYSREKAKEIITKLWEEVENRKIIFEYENFKSEINLAKLKPEISVDEVIDEAYKIGRNSNIFVDNYEILFTLINKKNIIPQIKYSDEEFNKIINEISSNLPEYVQESSYYREGNNLILLKGKSGIKINEDILKEQIYKSFYDEKEEYTIILPMEQGIPKEIDLEKIRKEIYKEAQNAYIAEDTLQVHPHLEGVDFAISIEEIEEMLKDQKDEYYIPLKITIPEKTTTQLGLEAFPNMLSTYTTRYDASSKNRSTNLELATSKINGTILLPGEEFSFNQVVGKRTIENGYKESTAYSGGKVVTDVGGGICQLSSTLYNSVLLANLEIIRRTNHHFLTSYVPAGRDATVYWGSIDFKFKNSRNYPIKIVATSQNGIAKVDIYGIREEREYEVIIQSKITSSIPYETTYKVDPTIGNEIIEQIGANGCTSETYKIIKYNGNVISETLISKDYYHPMEQIILNGSQTTKKDEQEDEIEGQFNQLNPDLKPEQ